VSSSAEVNPSKVSRYHHGDLRNTLLSAARDLAAETGVDGFTLREVARRAGVSHTAPYHHFPDKAALVRALAIDAFKILTRDLQDAADSAKQPLEQLQRIGERYVEFALAHPVEFRFMFRRDLCLTNAEGGDDPLETESLNAQAVLETAVTDAAKQGQLEGNPKHVALTAWSGVHGLSTLILDAPGFAEVSSETAAHMAREVIRGLRLGFERR
jgi:AcrR family transcriptional regulator